MTTVLLDTHIVQWFSAEPQKLSAKASEAIEAADELAVAAITWYELAWLARNGRINVAKPIRTWISELAKNLRTIDLSPTIAETAVALPDTFPGDPADRIIYATAIENGYELVTKDQRLRSHKHPTPITIW